MGEIPKEVTSLKRLHSLNFSFNILTGWIPENIGDMGSLESIDFSTNQLSSQLPQSMSSLTFLSQLNLSNNHLVGNQALSYRASMHPVLLATNFVDLHLLIIVS